jgi:hypothetical protein
MFLKLVSCVSFLLPYRQGRDKAFGVRLLTPKYNTADGLSEISPRISGSSTIGVRWENKSEDVSE